MGMRAFEAVVREVVRETADTVTLTLEADVPRDYRAGQFVNIDPHALAGTRARARELEELKGKKERARPFSLASAPHEPLLAITIKEEPAGQFPSLISPYLVRDVRPGDKLPCAGYAGLYLLPDDLPAGAQVVHLCAGSGIVPNFGMIKDALHRGLPIKQTLLYSNGRGRTSSTGISWRRWRRLIPEQLTILHAITREHPGVEAGARMGRVSAELLREHIREFDNAWFFVCGPSIRAHERLAARARGEQAEPRFIGEHEGVAAGAGCAKATHQRRGLVILRCTRRTADHSDSVRRAVTFGSGGFPARGS